MENARNFKIDIMKVIGLLGIILAHVGPNMKVIQIRNFDVPMMVFISGFLSYNSYKSCDSYVKYVYKRLKRLLFPTWIFLTIYFLVLLFNKYKFNLQFPYTISQIKRSYLLLDGIGYVWIVRVYLLCALIVPFLVKLFNRLGTKNTYIIIIVLFIINELLCHYNLYNISFFNKYILAYLISYGIITLLGIAANKSNNNIFQINFLIFLIIFFLYIMYFYKLYGKFMYTQYKKYPPTLYYLSYSMIVTYFIMQMKIKIEMNAFIKRIVLFISKSSFWIYLWHIYTIYVVNTIYPSITWYFRYILVSLLAFFITFIQNKIINFLEKKKINKLNNILSLFKG